MDNDIKKEYILLTLTQNIHISLNYIDHGYCEHLIIVQI